MKIAHLQIKDAFKNNATLVCSLLDGSIVYTIYRGWGSSGMSLSEDYVSDRLPVSKSHDNETAEQFKARLIQYINQSSLGCKVINDIPVGISF